MYDRYRCNTHLYYEGSTPCPDCHPPMMPIEAIMEGLSTYVPVQLVRFENEREIARPLAEIRDELNDAIQEIIGGDPDFEKFGAGLDVNDRKWPLRWAHIAAYPVTGESEGHWVHVDLIIPIDGEMKTERVFQTKTFAGFAHACKLACVAARVLGA